MGFGFCCAVVNFFFFWPCCAVLVPQPGLNPGPWEWKCWALTLDPQKSSLQSWLSTSKWNLASAALIKWLLTDLIQCFDLNSCESDTENTDPNYEEEGVGLEHNGCWDGWKANSLLKLSPVICLGRCSFRSVCICFLDATLPPKCCLSYMFKESDASTRCMAENNYDKESCSSHFLKYKNCRKFWVSLARSPLSELICYAWVWSLRFVRTHHPSLVMAVESPPFWPQPLCALRTLGHTRWVPHPLPHVTTQLQLRWVFLRGSVSCHRVSFLEVDGMAGLPRHHVYLPPLPPLLPMVPTFSHIL